MSDLVNGGTEKPLQKIFFPTHEENMWVQINQNLIPWVCLYPSIYTLSLKNISCLGLSNIPTATTRICKPNTYYKYLHIFQNISIPRANAAYVGVNGDIILQIYHHYCSSTLHVLSNMDTGKWSKNWKPLTAPISQGIMLTMTFGRINFTRSYQGFLPKWVITRETFEIPTVVSWRGFSELLSTVFRFRLATFSY